MFLHHSVYLETFTCSGNPSMRDLIACNDGLDSIDRIITKACNPKENINTLSHHANENEELNTALSEMQCPFNNGQPKPTIPECVVWPTYDKKPSSDIDDRKLDFDDVKQKLIKKERKKSSSREGLVESKQISAEFKKLQRSISRQRSQIPTEILPEIKIQTVDGSFKSVKERERPVLENLEKNISTNSSFREELNAKEKGYVTSFSAVKKDA